MAGFAGLVGEMQPLHQVRAQVRGRQGGGSDDEAIHQNRDAPVGRPDHGTGKGGDTITVTVDDDETGSLTNVATVTSDVADPNTENNSVAETTRNLHSYLAALEDPTTEAVR